MYSFILSDALLLLIPLDVTIDRSVALTSLSPCLTAVDRFFLFASKHSRTFVRVSTLQLPGVDARMDMSVIAKCLLF